MIIIIKAPFFTIEFCKIASCVTGLNKFPPCKEYIKIRIDRSVCMFIATVIIIARKR